jgi:hypothetical protein
MSGETITHIGAFEILNRIMIMLGFSTRMSGEAIFDQTKKSQVVTHTN